MKTIIQMQVVQFFTRKWFFLLLGCVLISIGERQSTAGSYEIYVLEMLTEHYYLTYFMIPVYLLFLFQSLGKNLEYILIRTKYFWKSFLARAIGSTINVFMFVTIQVVVFLLVGIGLESSNQFPVMDSPNHEVTYFLGQYFPSQTMAIVIVSLFMVIGLSTVTVGLLVVHHFFEEKITAVILIVLYILMTFAIKIPGVSEVPIILINNYIIFHHNFSYPGKLFVTVCSMVMIYLTVYVLIRFFWQRSFSFSWRWRGVTSFYVRQLFTKKNMLFCIGIILVISLWKSNQAASFENASLKDYLTVLFYGHGTTEFHLFSFLEMLVMNSTPLYFLAVFLEEERRERNLAITIRLKHKKVWLKSIVGVGLLFVSFYVCSLVIVGNMVGMTFGFQGHEISLVMMITLMKLLDISFQYLLMLTIYTLSQNVTAAFLSVLSTNLLSLVVPYFPTGFSSLARSGQFGEHSSLTMTGTVLIAYLVVWIFLRTVSYKRMFQ